MNIDTIIVKRFEDLINESKNIPHSRVELVGECVDTQKYVKWATSVMGCIKSTWGEDSDYYKNFEKSFHMDKREHYFRDFQKGLGILESAYNDYTRGYIWTYRIALGAELTSDTLKQGYELLKLKYKDSACVCGRIALEISLKELCKKNGLPISKLNKMNEDLCKALVYNMGLQKQITAWADRGNDAAHGQYTNYNEQDVKELLDGISRFISDYLV